MRLLNPIEEPNWNEQIAEFSEATVFHTAEWARVLSETYGYRPGYYVEYDGENMSLIAPFMEVDSWLTGKRGVSLPFTDSCDFILRNGSKCDSVIDRICDIGQQRGWRYVETRGESVDPQESTSPTFYTHKLNLHRSEAELFDSLSSSVRRAIRKAEKSGLEVTIGTSPESVREFYRLNCLTRRRHGLPPQPFRFFEILGRQVLETGSGFVVLACLGDTPIAGAIFLHFGKRAIYKYGASDFDHRLLRGSNLVMWEAIKRYLGDGHDEFSFGITHVDNDGLRRFKQGWGTTEQGFSYARYTLPGRNLSEQSEYTERLSGWHNRLFRMAPTPVSRFVGAMLYRHVA